MNTIKQAFPDQEPTESIRRDAREIAEGIHRRHRQVVKTRRGVLGAAGTLALITAGAFAGPKAYAIYRINQVGGSLEGVKTMIHESFRLDASGHPVSTGKMVYSEGKWRIERGSSTQIYVGQTLWTYDTKSGFVTKQVKPEGPFGYNASGMTIKAMIADILRWRWQSETEISTGSYGDRKAEILTVQNQDDSRLKVYADPGTHMPFRMSTEELGTSGWSETGYSVPTYDVTVDPMAFNLPATTTAQLVDVDAIAKKWTALDRKPVATLKAGTNELRVLDAFVNERGHIFVLFLDGETLAERQEYARTMLRKDGTPPSHWHVVPRFNATDNLGTVYRPDTGFDIAGFVTGTRTSGLVRSDGLILQAGWIIPDKVATWRPRKITLFAKMGWTDEATSSFTIDAAKPAGVLPEWMFACAIGPRTSEDVLRAETKPARSIPAGN